DKLFWHYAKQNGPALARWIDAAVDELLNLRDRLAGPDDERQLMKSWEHVETSMGTWRNNKRQLQESTMPPTSDLRPNFFGSKAALNRFRGTKSSDT
ncbi:MAG TPA: hypothetical protein VMW62_18250, partial [Chloroflexota bacterium]|nr:hypothetical protein [Chloroflexota bacterium]